MGTILSISYDFTHVYHKQFLIDIRRHGSIFMELNVSRCLKKEKKIRY